MTINLDQYTNTLNVTDTATNADLNVATKGTGVIKFSNGGGEAFRTLDAGTTSGSAYWTIQGSSGGFPFISVDGTNPNINAVIATKGSGAVRFYTGGTSGVEQLRVTHTASAVNYVQATGGATGNAPYFSSQGSDTNISFAYTAKGTGNHDFYTSGTSFTQQLRISHTASAVNYVQVTGSVTGGLPAISAQGSDSNVSLLLKSKGTANTVIQNESATFFQNLSGASQFRAASTASAVNYLSATGSIASSSPVLSALGSDTNIDLAFTPKGTGGVINNVNGNSLTVTRNTGLNIMKVTAANTQNLALQATGGGSVYLKTGDDTSTQFVAAFTASAVNFLQAAGSVTGSGVTLSAQGSDTNIDLTLTPKGTGNVRFGTYTANMALTIQGYVEIKDSGGTVRRLAVIA